MTHEEGADLRAQIRRLSDWERPVESIPEWLWEQVCRPDPGLGGPTPERIAAAILAAGWVRGGREAVLRELARRTERPPSGWSS